MIKFTLVKHGFRPRSNTVYVIIEKLIRSKELRLGGVLFVLALIVGGCSSTPPLRNDSIHQGQWTTKVLVRDKIKNKSATLSMDATAALPDRLRLTATATLGISVMELALNKEQVTYLLPRQKKYFAGVVNDRVFSHIIHDLPLDPRWIISLLFDKPIRGEGWICTNATVPGTDKSVLAGCDNDTSQIKVQVTNRVGERRLIFVSAPRAELKIQIQDFTGDIHPSDAMFTLAKPDDFVDISNK